MKARTNINRYDSTHQQYQHWRWLTFGIRHKTENQDVLVWIIFLLLSFNLFYLHFYFHFMTILVLQLAKDNILYSFPQLLAQFSVLVFFFFCDLLVRKIISLLLNPLIPCSFQHNQGLLFKISIFQFEFCWYFNCWTFLCSATLKNLVILFNGSLSRLIQISSKWKERKPLRWYLGPVFEE